MTDVPWDAIDSVIEFSKKQDDGCISVIIPSENPDSVLLVATSRRPERVQLLKALHECWYKEEASD